MTTVEENIYYRDYWDECYRTRCYCGLSFGLHFDGCIFDGITFNNGEPEPKGEIT